MRPSARGASRRVAVSLVCCLVTVALSSCSGSSSKPHQLDAATVQKLADGITDSLSQAQDKWQLQRVEQVLVQRCMQSQGLTYYITSGGPYPSARRATDDEISATPTAGYGIFDQVSAQEAGVPSGSSATSRQDQYVSSLGGAQQSAYLLAYFGPDSSRKSVKEPGGGSITVPSVGCLATAETQIYGSPEVKAQQDYIPQLIRNQILAEIATNTAVVSSRQSWATCMQQAGFSYTSPAAAVEEITLDYSRLGLKPSVHAKEMNVAQADARCDARTGFRATQRTARAAALSTLSTELEKQELDVLVVRAAAVAKAKQALGTGG